MQAAPTQISLTDEIFQIGDRLREILKGETASLESVDLNHLIGAFPDLLLLAIEQDRFLPALEDDFRRSFSHFNVGDWREVFGPLKPATLASIIAALPLNDADLSEMPSLRSIKPNRVLALETADTLTAEEAQELYRFAVLVTKLV